MLRRVRLAAGTAMFAVLLSGCGLAAVWNEVPHRAPEFTPAPTTAEPDERSRHPYSGRLAPGAECVTAPGDLLSQLQDVGGVGGAVTYPRGALVKANPPWWTVAVATRVNANGSGLDAGNVAPYAYFVTNYPTYAEDDFEHELFEWQIEPGEYDRAAARALACLKRIPVPKPEPPPGSPQTYTGRLARGAKCSPASAELLAHLEQVGQVGGAITYPKGQLVRANGKWWTVAVATQVHPNSDGYTSAPATELFVTNAPAYRARRRRRRSTSRSRNASGTWPRRRLSAACGRGEARLPDQLEPVAEVDLAEEPPPGSPEATGGAPRHLCAGRPPSDLRSSCPGVGTPRQR